MMRFVLAAKLGLALILTGTVMGIPNSQSTKPNVPILISEALQQERLVVRVPGDYSTIQAAVDAVAEGGTVLVGPGLYKENVQITKSVRINRGWARTSANAGY